MNLLYLLKICWINIKSKRMAALFSASGLFISTVVIITVFAISFGVDNTVSKEMGRNASERKITVSQSSNGLIKIDQNMVKNISLIDGVESIEQLAEISGKISYSGSTTDVIAGAATSGYFAGASILLSEGVELKAVETGEPNPIIINSVLAKVFDFKNPKDFLGQEVYLDLIMSRQNSLQSAEKNLNEEQKAIGKFRIVAVINFGDKPLAYLPHEVAVDNGLSYDSYIWPTVRNSSQLTLLRAKIENLGLSTSGISDSISEVKKLFIFIRIGLLALAFVILTISALSMISAARADIAKRRQEIAFQKAMGINSKTIFTMLLIENIYLVAIGFISGLVLSSIIGRLINLVFKHIATDSYYQYYPLFVLPWNFLLALIIAIVIFIIMISISSYHESKNILAKESWTHG